MFTRAIVSKVSRNFAQGLSGQMEQHLGSPNLQLAHEQHAAYINALESAGLEVEVLQADDDHPDSTFVEDVAVVTAECAIITNPAPQSRKGETARMVQVLKRHRPHIYQIDSPGTLEGGDVLQIDREFYVGITERTNEHGAKQLKSILEPYGYNVTFIPLHRLFHLKCAVAYLGNNCITIGDELVGHAAFQRYKQILVSREDLYSCNTLGINGHIITPAGYPRTASALSAAGFSVTELDVSEFRKQDGGLTCLSLRF